MIRRVLRSLVAVGLMVVNLLASEQHGEVTFGGLPVPGATVTATQGDKKITAVTDPTGRIFFSGSRGRSLDHSSGDVRLFDAQRRITVGPGTKPSKWELKMLPLDQIHAEAQLVAPPQARCTTARAKRNAPRTTKKPEPQAAPADETEPARDEMAQRATDGLLINGSQNNGASSPFALFPAFGNNRNGSRSLYNGGLGMFVDNSTWDARQFSITGQNTPKPGYNLFMRTAYFGGPLRIPHLLKNGPNFFVGYQWMRNRNDTIGTALMPTARNARATSRRASSIPKSQISPQALAC